MRSSDAQNAEHDSADPESQPSPPLLQPQEVSFLVHLPLQTCSLTLGLSNELLSHTDVAPPSSCLLLSLALSTAPNLNHGPLLHIQLWDRTGPPVRLVDNASLHSLGVAKAC